MCPVCTTWVLMLTGTISPPWTKAQRYTGFNPQKHKMFSLIITIVSIALVAAIAVATIYYGGPALQRGKAQAAAAGVINEGQQISASLTLYKSQTGMTATNFDDLMAQGYLSSIPEGWDISEGYAFRPESSYQVCLESNKKSGVDLVPDCSDEAYANQAICCSVAAEAT